MRRAALLLLLALLLVGGGYGAGWTGDYRSRIVDGIHYVADVGGAGVLALFDAPLNTNGLTAVAAGSVSITGVAAPDYVWWADDHLGSGGLTTEACTANGGASIDSPFCSDGSFSDLTSGCMTGRRLNGTNEDCFSTANTGGAGQASGDITVCALFRTTATGGQKIAGQREGSAGEGWDLDLSSSTLRFTVENHAGGSTTAIYNNADPMDSAWHIGCGSSDFDGNVTPYMDGDADTAAAGPGGTQAPAAKFRVGRDNTGGADFTGDIAFVFVWNSLLDATDMEELFEYFVGILDNEGAPVEFSSTGPNCCWVSGAVECFGDDWPMLGCELPPGVTGAGSPASGYYSGEAITNYATGSRIMSTGGTPTNGWTESGGGNEIVCGQTASPFRDGRTTCLITDDNAGLFEYPLLTLSGVASTCGLNHGDKVRVQWTARGPSGGEKLDFIGRELTGATCTGAADSSYTPATLTTSWTTYGHTWTITDVDCTDWHIKFYPYDTDDGVSATGSVYITDVHVLCDQDWSIPISIETGATAVGAGDDVSSYDISGVAGLATVATGTTISLDYTPMAGGATVGNIYLFDLEDSATATDFYRLYIAVSDGDINFVGQSAEQGAPRTLFSTSAGNTWTAGTTYSIEIVLGLDGSTTLSRDGTPIAPATQQSLTGPNSLDDLYLGAYSGSSNQPNAAVENFQVVAP